MNVFNSSYANQYDAMYGDKDYVAECDLVASAAEGNDIVPTRILDIGCGTGGHSFEWARRGISCVGVDMSPAMIAIAESKADSLRGHDLSFWLVMRRHFGRRVNSTLQP